MNRSTRLDARPRGRWSRRSGPKKRPGPGAAAAAGAARARAPARPGRARRRSACSGPIRGRRSSSREEALADGRHDLARGTAPRGAGAACLRHLPRVLDVRDKAGNIGTSPPLDRNGLPYGTACGARCPAAAASCPLACRPVQPPVDARAGRQGAWSSRRRRAGGPTRGGAPRRRRARHPRGARTKPTARASPEGARRASRALPLRGDRRTAPVTVAVRQPVRRPRARVLVVLPMTWQGRNAVDDDGDGPPNLLDRGAGPARPRLRRRRPARRLRRPRRPAAGVAGPHEHALRRHHRRRPGPRARAHVERPPRRCCCPATPAGCPGGPACACGASCAAAGASRRWARTRCAARSR